MKNQFTAAERRPEQTWGVILRTIRQELSLFFTISHKIREKTVNIYPVRDAFYIDNGSSLSYLMG